MVTHGNQYSSPNVSQCAVLIMIVSIIELTPDHRNGIQNLVRTVAGIAERFQRSAKLILREIVLDHQP
jgi:hypothetical protein